ncbi:MAG: toll/interleukin-1 receptor domain-containing protein, partial [Sphingomicrobium sp.]
MANVFLSYDHEDIALAKPLALALEKAGHTVWYDRHIHGGAQYSHKIEQALDAADAVIVLWSPRSLESAWVRDEAAEARDRGKLVPLTIAGVTPPMGFRQFQTIELGNWNGRGKVPKLDALLEAVNSQAAEASALPSAKPALAAAPQRAPASPSRRRLGLVVGGAAVITALGGGLAWELLSQSGLPVVEVAAANSSPRSQAAASDLFVKLGSLAQVGEGKWQLIDSASAPKHPDFVFRTADTGSSASPQANLVLLDGQDSSLLWSHEFQSPAGGEADLRQQLSLTAGRVLGCALETRDAGGLRRDLLKTFLNVCATLAENSVMEPGQTTRPLRQIVTKVPKFTPAWGRLLSADITQVDISEPNSAEAVAMARELRNDMETVRSIAPDLPELALAEVSMMPRT